MKKPKQTTQVKDISEIKEGMTLYIEYIPGKAKKIILESKTNAKEQMDFKRFWRCSIGLGVVYKLI